MTLSTLLSKVPCIHWTLTPEAQISLCDQPFSRYKLVEKWKPTEWPQDNLKHLNDKSLASYPVHTEYSASSPNFTQFHSTTSRFRDTRLAKISNARNDPRMTLTTQLSKIPRLHRILTPEDQISLRFAQWQVIFSRYRLVENRKCTECPQNDLNQFTVKSTL